MTDAINRIGVNNIPLSVNPDGGNKKSDILPEEKKADVENKNTYEGVSPNTVLDNMAVASAYMKPVTQPKVIDNATVEKYVTPEQAERIAGFVTSFEDIVANNLAAIAKELPGLNADSQMSLALKMTE